MDAYRVSNTNGPEHGYTELTDIIECTQKNLRILCSDYSEIISLLFVNRRQTWASIKPVLDYYEGNVDLLVYVDKDLKDAVKRTEIIETLGKYKNAKVIFMPASPKITYLISDKRAVAVEDLSKSEGINVFRNNLKIADEWIKNFEEMKRLSIRG